MESCEAIAFSGQSERPTEEDDWLCQKGIEVADVMQVRCIIFGLFPDMKLSQALGVSAFLYEHATLERGLWSIG